jgi:hypothetical protein
MICPAFSRKPQHLQKQSDRAGRMDGGQPHRIRQGASRHPDTDTNTRARNAGQINQIQSSKRTLETETALLLDCQMSLTNYLQIPAGALVIWGY